MHVSKLISTFMVMDFYLKQLQKDIVEVAPFK